MSTCVNSLYRPIKISDISSLGFEIEEDENGSSLFKIQKDKIKFYVHFWERFYKKIGHEIDLQQYEYFYIHHWGIVEHRGHECVQGFTRYNVNSPALSLLLEGLTKLGYKLKVEDERYDHEYELEFRKNLLAESE